MTDRSGAVLCCLTATLFIVGASGAEGSNACVAPSLRQGHTSTSRDHSRTELIVASLNIAARAQMVEVVGAWIARRSIDVLLLQEVGEVAAEGEAFAAALGGRLGFHFAYASASLADGADQEGLAIVSRYPLEHVSVQPLKRHRLRFRSRCRMALAASVALPHGSVRVVNVHLDTRINSGNRLAQLRPVLNDLLGSDAPQLIGGDFNTADVGWFQSMWPMPYAQRQSRAVRELLESNGFRTPFNGTPATFKVLFIPLRLDWLYMKQLQPDAWGVDHVALTDHRGVWARVSRSDLRLQ
jgi:endonuclease/exonuclease/phosphatase family metal-dependent hydrolase